MMFETIIKEVQDFNGERVRFHRKRIEFIFENGTRSYDTSRLSNIECGIIVAELRAKMGHEEVTRV